MRYRYAISYESDTNPVETFAANLTRGTSGPAAPRGGRERLSGIRKAGSSDP